MHILIPRIQITVAGHTTEAPEVLILAVAAVTPTEHLEGKEVVTAMQIRRDIKLCGHLTVFRITHELSVHPQIDIRGDTAEVGDDLLTIPVVRDLDNLAVAAHVVVFHRHIGRVVLEMSFPCKTDIHIDRVAEAVYFPDGWDLHRAPTLVVIVGLVEIGGTLVGVLYPFEVPVAMQGEEILRGIHVPFECFLLILVGKE